MPKLQLPFARLIKFVDLTPAPWKNGGGVTREILVHPPGASFAEENYTWRLSTAEIRASGPFSLFPDFERLITLVDGDELLVHLPDGPKALKQDQVLHFSGAETVNVDLVKGPVSDLGLIFDPDMATASISSVHVEQRPRSFVLGAGTLIFFAKDGDCDATVYPGEGEYRLTRGDSLVLTPFTDERLVMFEAKSGTNLLAVEIAERQMSRA